MKKIAVLGALVVFLAACGAALGPKATVEKMVNAFQNKDGKAMVECMHPNALAEINEGLEEMKQDPEGTAAMMMFLGIETTADEIRNLDAGGMLTMFLGSPMFAEEFEGMTFQVGAERIEGDLGWVELTVNGETDEVALVKYEGRWVFDPESDFDLMNF